MKRRESCPESLTAYSFPLRRHSSKHDLRLDTYINYRKLTPPTTPKYSDRWHRRSSAALIEPAKNGVCHSPHTSVSETSESHTLSAPSTPASSHYITTRPTDVLIDLDDPSKSRRPSQLIYLPHTPREKYRDEQDDMLDLKEFLKEEAYKKSQFEYLRNFQLTNPDNWHV